MLVLFLEFDIISKKKYRKTSLIFTSDLRMAQNGEGRFPVRFALRPTQYDMNKIEMGVCLGKRKSRLSHFRIGKRTFFLLSVNSMVRI